MDLGLAWDMAKAYRNSESLEEKMRKLKRKMDTLKSMEEDANIDLRGAEMLPMKKRKKSVDDWLTSVGEKENQVQQLTEEAQEAGLLNSLPLHKKVDKVISEVTQLINEGSFPEGLVHDDSNRGLPIPAPELVGQMFEERKNEIHEILNDDNILTIGIYGMGGVGKTTLITHIHNELLNFPNTSVFWVTGSQNFSINKLQNSIAKAILTTDLKNDDDMFKRAAILAEALRRINNPVLIIDDLWDEFSLDSIGIGNNGARCKVILTTRSLQVCNRMDCGKQIIVNPLSDGEAWVLFTKTLGTGTALSPEIEEIAKCLAKECAGLPLGIIVTAGSMRRVTDIHEWSDALETIKRSTGDQYDNMQLDEKVYKVLRHSYDMLKHPQLQECFLYCSLYPEDFEIDRDELIASFIDERLINKMGTRKAEFHRGDAILNRLENVCLLQGGINSLREMKYVRMHDLVRDMALRIASSDSCRFLVEAGVEDIDEAHQEKWSEALERVSFIRSKGISNVYFSTASAPMCPKLSTLLLSHCAICVIPDDFFTNMIGLTILDLSLTGIVKLPSSVSNLKSLTALLLRGCMYLKELCPLSNLTNLERLELSNSGIKKLPEGMEMLTKLRVLHLHPTTQLKKIPQGILPKLCHLQSLKLHYLNNKQIVRAKEIASLRKLETLSGNFSNIKELETYLTSWEACGPNNYTLAVGRKYECHRLVARPAIEGIETRVVDIHMCDDLGMLCQIESLKWVKDLQHCRVFNCDQMTHVLCTYCDNHPFVQCLRSLVLSDLCNLCDLIGRGRGRGRGGSPSAAVPTALFSSLKRLHIDNCPKIKKLFTVALLSHLQNLQHLLARHCERLVEIIEDDEDEEDHEASAAASNIFTSTLPNFKYLLLEGLPELKSFCSSRKIISDSLQFILITGCPKLERFPLLREDPHSTLTSLSTIRVDKDWWESIEFDLPNTKDTLRNRLKVFFIW